MIAQWLSPAAEQAELRALNERLRGYVRRVGELERENRRLEAAVRLGTEALGEGGRGSRCAQEARGLRRRLDELGRATVRAEGECGVLRRELEELRALSGETRAARGRLDAELGAQRRELADALAERAALEALLGRLEAERGHLAAAHEHRMRELRARAEAGAFRPLQVRPVAAAAPAPCASPLQEVRAGCARLVAEAWGETVRLYEGQVWELSEALRRDQESRRQAEEEARRGAQEAQALRKEVMELEGLQVRLEDELRRMHEAFELQAQEGQRAIACLEEEKEALTMAMAERLRDCQELVQVKTGLSLEVATYRALLEGENNTDLLVLTERLECLPLEFCKPIYKPSSAMRLQESERSFLSRLKAPRMSSAPHWPADTVPRAGWGLLSSFGATRDAYRKPGGETNLRHFPPAQELRSHQVALQETSPQRPGAPPELAREAGGAHEPAKDRVIVLERKVGAQSPGESEWKVREEKVFESKERASEERNLRWEELTKLDKAARERECGRLQMAVGREHWRQRSEAERGVSTGSQEQAPRSTAQEPQQKPAVEPGATATDGREERGSGLGFPEGSPVRGDPTTQALAEHIVTGILEQFARSPEPGSSARTVPDTKVTYVGREERAGAESAHTEIVVESKLTEEVDVDVADETSLDSLLSRGALELELTGPSAERLIGDLVQRGLQGRARVVDVQIVEESGGFSEPPEDAEAGTAQDRVDEAEVSTPGSGDEAGGLLWEQQQQQQSFPREKGRVGEWVQELHYFVSTPDDDESPDGCSPWRDEQGLGRPGKKDDAGAGAGLGSGPRKEHSGSSQFQMTDPIPAEKFRVTSDIHTSRLTKVQEQLGENLSECMRKELSAQASQARGELGSVSVDVHRVQPMGREGATFVAEVNLSRTLDAHEVDLETLSRDEEGELERVVQAAVRESLARQRSPEPSSPEDTEAGDAPPAGALFKRWATQELYRASTEPATTKAPSWPRIQEEEGPAVRRVEIGPAGVWRTEPSPGALQVDLRSRDTAGAQSLRTSAPFPAATTVEVPGTWRDTGGGPGRAAVGGSPQSPGELGKVLTKSVELQGKEGQGDEVQEMKKVAFLYLDKQEEEEEGGHWF